MQEYISWQGIVPSLRATLAIHNRLCLAYLPKYIESVHVHCQRAFEKCLCQPRVPHEAVVIHCVIIKTRALHLVDVACKLKAQWQLDHKLASGEIGGGVCGHEVLATARHPVVVDSGYQHDHEVPAPVIRQGH